jgi:hypothetical protein
MTNARTHARFLKDENTDAALPAAVAGLTAD